jgi:hypothetical protein
MALIIFPPQTELAVTIVNVIDPLEALCVWNIPPSVWGNGTLLTFRPIPDSNLHNVAPRDTLACTGIKQSLQVTPAISLETSDEMSSPVNLSLSCRAGSDLTAVSTSEL